MKNNLVFFLFFSALEKIIWLKYSSNWAKDDFGSSTLYKTGSTFLYVSKLKTVSRPYIPSATLSQYVSVSVALRRKSRERWRWIWIWIWICTDVWNVGFGSKHCSCSTHLETSDSWNVYIPICFLSFPFFRFFVFLEFHLHSTINFLICWLW